MVDEGAVERNWTRIWRIRRVSLDVPLGGVLGRGCGWVRGSKSWPGSGSIHTRHVGGVPWSISASEGILLVVRFIKAVQHRSRQDSGRKGRVFG